MTLERAIEILDPEHREHYDSIETVNEACRMGMEAIGYRISKKATHPYEHCINAQCPACGDWEWSTYKSRWKPNFCPNCGQALDWSDKECANG